MANLHQRVEADRLAVSLVTSCSLVVKAEWSPATWYATVSSELALNKGLVQIPRFASLYDRKPYQERVHKYARPNKTMNKVEKHLKKFSHQGQVLGVLLPQIQATSLLLIDCTVCDKRAALFRISVNWLLVAMQWLRRNGPTQYNLRRLGFDRTTASKYGLAII